MSLIRMFFVVFLAHSVLCKALEKRDIPMFGTQPGMPINTLQINLDSGNNVTLKDIFVTGLKKLVLQNFKYDTSKHSVVFTMDAAVDVQAVVEENLNSLPALDMSLLRPCSKTDTICLTYSIQHFLEETSGGNSGLNLKPIDPMPIATVTVDLDSGTYKKVTLEDVSVTGLKKLIVSHFKLDTSKKSVVFSMTVDLEIRANIEVDSKKSSTLSAKGQVTSTADFDYELVTNEKGVQYFTFGPDTIFCDSQSVAQLKLDSAADKLLLQGQTYPNEIKKNLLCSIIEPAFHTIIHNLRESAKFYPKTSYFTDL